MWSRVRPVLVSQTCWKTGVTSWLVTLSPLLLLLTFSYQSSFHPRLLQLPTWSLYASGVSGNILGEVSQWCHLVWNDTVPFSNQVTNMKGVILKTYVCVCLCQLKPQKLPCTRHVNIHKHVHLDPGNYQTQKIDTWGRLQNHCACPRAGFASPGEKMTVTQSPASTQHNCS